MRASRSLSPAECCEDRHEIGRPAGDRLFLIAEGFLRLNPKRVLRILELLGSDRPILDQRCNKCAEDQCNGFAVDRLKIHEELSRAGSDDRTMTEAAGASSSSRGGASTW